MLNFRLVQFDSYGAKSSCTYVSTRDIRIIIDPGVSIMHPTFPADMDDKVGWVREGQVRIYSALEDADIIIVTHYHHDHYIEDDPEIYMDRSMILLKNPNIYINKSQRRRALEFLEMIYRHVDLEVEYGQLNEPDLPDPGLNLKSVNMDLGEYNERRRELIRSGREWFNGLKGEWLKWGYIPELRHGRIRIGYPEGRTYRFGDTIVRFTHPLFHGIEYSRVGWVYSVIIEYGGEKLLYSSDLNGPMIEDYADMIIREKPDILIIDGPMTYMLGYTLNMINFRRIINNMHRIIDNTDFRLLIWDHHLPRERRFRERTMEVWRHAERRGKEMLTAREYEYGRRPIIEEL